MDGYEIRAGLDRLVPMDPAPAAWEDVLARSRAGRSRVVSRIGFAVAAAVAIVALAAVLQWGGSRPSIVGRALAAVGDEPVLHAVIREHQAGRYALVDIASGKTTRPEQTLETEIWFDKADSLGHTITRVDGTVDDDTLQTPSGTTNMDGVVYTCAWIAAHPVEATKERVSCHFNGDNGTTPHSIPEAPPSVDPALAVFLTGYRDALASGAARVVGDGTVDGTPVYWIQLAPVTPPPVPGSEPPPDAAPPEPIVERVAVARDSYRPLLVDSQQGPMHRRYQVAEIATVGKDDADFSAPPRRPATDEVSIGSVLNPRTATPAEAAAALGRAPLWLGGRYFGLPLAETRIVTLRTGYSRQSGLAPRFDVGVELIYGSVEHGRPAEGSIVLQEATVPSYALSWDTRTPEPPAGSIMVIGPGFPARLKTGGLYLTISGIDSDATLAAAARALVPLDAGPRRP
jgi:hypothetical protein